MPPKKVAQAPRPLRQPEARPLTLRLKGGLVLYLSTLYCGPQARSGKGRGREGAGLYPELAVLGVSEGSSPALASLVGRQCSLLPSYQVARAELAARGTDLDIKVVHRVARQLGASVLTSRTRDLLRWRAAALPAGKELAGKRVAARSDGGRTRLRTVIRKQKGKGKGKKQRRHYQAEWLQPKLLIIFEIDDKGRRKAKTRPWIDGRFAGPDEAMELLAFHLHPLGVAAAQVVVFGADGAPWVWDRLDWVQKRVGVMASRVGWVLDWCHAVHNLSVGLEALGLPEEERQRVFGQLRQWLRRGWCGLVIGKLQSLGERRGCPKALFAAVGVSEEACGGRSHGVRPVQTQRPTAPERCDRKCGASGDQPASEGSGVDVGGEERGGCVGAASGSGDGTLGRDADTGPGRHEPRPSTGLGLASTGYAGGTEGQDADQTANATTGSRIRRS